MTSGQKELSGAAVLARNNVRISRVAAGPVMVFAHGFGCDQNMWRHATSRRASPTGTGWCSTTRSVPGV